ncbi:MAG: hypothetical protein E6J31_10385 [Chloroflexi bacterium]|nr:MAG: hypothetical protein E6J31_10385 [Chloroflexota bacterium]
MNEAFGKVMIEEKAMQHYSPAQFAPLDRQEFQSLYRENLGPIYRYVYSKVRNREEAEDLTSHIFIKAVRHIDHAYDPHSTRSWLFQVARHDRRLLANLLPFSDKFVGCAGRSRLGGSG